MKLPFDGSSFTSVSGGAGSGDVLSSVVMMVEVSSPWSRPAGGGGSSVTLSLITGASLQTDRGGGSYILSNSSSKKKCFYFKYQN